MSRVIDKSDHNIEIGQWVAMRIPEIGTVDRLGDFSSMAFMSHDMTEMYAGVVFYNYRKPHDIEMVVAADSPKFMTRRNIALIFGYPFNQLGCSRITVITHKKNKKARRLIEGMGFKLEGVCRKAIDGIKDAMIYGMLKHEAYRWMKGQNNGQKVITECPSSS
jgi:hypothetical protein